MSAGLPSRFAGESRQQLVNHIYLILPTWLSKYTAVEQAKKASS